VWRVKIREETEMKSNEIKKTVSQEDCLAKETVRAATSKEEKLPKKKGKPRGGNSPVIGNNGLMVEPGDNAKYLSLNMELFNMPSIDLKNVEEVQQRLNDYFMLYSKYDTKPTVAGMAMALNGMSRQTLRAIAIGAPTGGSGYKTALPPEVANAIKRAYFLMENLWENYMQNGKINPVSGIFLGKNNYGYQDKTEYVLTPNAGQDEDYSADDIRKRYIQTTEPKRLSNANSSTDHD
jgi:hypothetical protein